MPLASSTGLTSISVTGNVEATLVVDGRVGLVTSSLVADQPHGELRPGERLRQSRLVRARSVVQLALILHHRLLGDAHPRTFRAGLTNKGRSFPRPAVPRR